ncbi:polysaccharide deacetylase family protein [Streptomyces sp. NBC_00234]|uniref:polysaccharide deacetylase family protein n=1 Tax=Streptomyces sp. NBC_00234 TaxID=2903638 RepID=UPI002E27FEEB|nr:polysaccharide deacetylase family protein [Streptomyces sp. NBC_00234]
MSLTTDAARRTAWYERYERWHGLDRALRRSPAQLWFRHRAVGRLAVLGYHGVEDPAAFAAQLDRLIRTARPVSLGQVEAAVRDGVPLPPRSVLVTFDDGDPSVLEHGLPLLTERGIPAVCFVIAGLIGTDEPFWWDELEHLLAHGGTYRGLSRDIPPHAAAYALKQLPDAQRLHSFAELRKTASVTAPRRRQLTAADLRTLEAGGVTIGSHTLTHPCLDRCDETTVLDEVHESHRLLTAHLGHAPTAFAYPNGDFDARADAVLRELGYRSGFLYDHALSDPAAQHPLRLSRLRVSTRTSPARFATVLSGLQPAVYRTGLGVVRAVRQVRARR